jgi:hypothetical protein
VITRYTWRTLLRRRDARNATRRRGMAAKMVPLALLPVLSAVSAAATASLTVSSSVGEGALAPAVYWISRPVLTDEVLMVAGAGLPSEANATVQFCRDPACEKLVERSPLLPSSWNSTLHVRLPPGCSKPPCILVLSSSSPLVVAVNGPEVSWVANRTRVGGLLRVFGRALAWDDGGCISGVAAPAPVASTMLYFGTGGSAVACAANCYEASFVLPNSVGAGKYPNAVLSTPWGNTSFGFDVLQPSSPVARQVDVEREHGGNIDSALAAAAVMATNLSRAERLEVLLADNKVYRQDSMLVVPSQTALVGGASGTVLEFAFPGDPPPAQPHTDWPCLRASGPHGESPGPGAGMTNMSACPPCLTGFGAGWELHNMSIIMRDWPAGAAVVEVPKNSSNVRLLGLNTTTTQHNSTQNAIRLLGRNIEVGWWRDTQMQGLCYGGALITRGASEVWVHDANLLRNCGGVMDWDATDSFILEDSSFEFTDAGSHQPFVSGGAFTVYDIIARPGARYASVARNSWRRPANTGVAQPTHHDWKEGSESFTSDAPGAWFAHGVLLDSDPKTGIVDTRWSFVGDTPHWPDTWGVPWTGATLLVIAGPGVGQHRTITSAPKGATMLPLDRPLAAQDELGQFAMAGAIVAVVPTIGMKNIVGNHFSWTEVVQFYGALPLRANPTAGRRSRAALHTQVGPLAV